jgi:hypothetical protein
MDSTSDSDTGNFHCVTSDNSTEVLPEVMQVHAFAFFRGWVQGKKGKEYRLEEN